MDLIAGIGLSGGIALAGVAMMWRLHGMGVVLAVGIALVAVGACGTVAALLGVGFLTVAVGAAAALLVIAALWAIAMGLAS